MLVATDIVADAAVVKGILSEEFDHVSASTDPDSAAADFLSQRPDVLVLAFNRLEKSERYYLGLYRLCPEINQHPHRTIILCDQSEVNRAAELCMKDIFDDYILFWPMTYDAPRLNMSVHNALRELSTSRTAGLQAGEASAQRQLMAELERMMAQQKARQEEHSEMASRAAKQSEPLRKTLMVVDDDEFQHKLVGKILESKDFHLVYAASGIDALSMMPGMLPDIILMDVVMPEMDGIETMRNLKAVPQLAGIPVIMITGKSEGKVVSECLKAGAVDFVVKPFDQAVLIAKIERALGTG
ncbi:MAG: response regulator [Sideroxyarcus sp.]|nr:response regulator [Sideroxyarcus sp.]